MKKLTDFLVEREEAIRPYKNQNIKFYDKNDSRINPSTTSPGTRFVGGAGWGKDIVDVDLWEVYPSEISDISLKPTEKIFRFSTYTTQVGGFWPMVKINLEKGLVYFLTDSAMETGKPSFETRGLKLRWLTLTKEQMV